MRCARAARGSTEGWPDGVDPAAQYALYAWLLAAFFSQTVEDADFEAMREAAEHSRNPWLEAQTATHRDWLRRSSLRLQARAIWQEWFASHDAFLMPVTIVPAFPHDHREMSARTLATAAGLRPYTDLAMWIAFATLDRLPGDRGAGRAHQRRTAGRHPDPRPVPRGRDADRRRA